METRRGPRRLGRRTLLAAAVGGLGGCAAPIFGGNDSKTSRRVDATSWEMVGANPHNTATLDAGIGSRIDDLSWSESVASQFASPIVTTSKHAVVHTQSKLLGFEKSDGTIAFSKSVPGGMAAAPAVTENHVLVPRDTYGEGFDSDIGLDSPRLYALDRETRRTAWTLALDGAYLASVAVADDVYAQSDRETCRVRPDGTVVWRQTFDRSFDWRDTLSYIRPVIGPNGVYVGHRDSLVKLDRTSGDVLWTRSMGKTLFPPVIAGDGTVVASTGRETVGLDPSNGRTSWRVSEPLLWAPASTGGIAVVSTPGKLLGIEHATGEQQWSTQLSLSTCPPVIAGTTVFVVPGGTDLVAIDAETGSRIDRRATDGTIDWITPDAGGLLTRQAETDGPALGRYQLR